MYTLSQQPSYPDLEWVDSSNVAYERGLFMYTLSQQPSYPDLEWVDSSNVAYERGFLAVSYYLGSGFSTGCEAT
jgi:hypothetical protein